MNRLYRPVPALEGEIPEMFGHPPHYVVGGCAIGGGGGRREEGHAHSVPVDTGTYTDAQPSRRFLP